MFQCEREPVSPLRRRYVDDLRISNTFHPAQPEPLGTRPSAKGVSQTTSWWIMPKRNRALFVSMLTLIWLGWGLTGVAAEPLPALDDLVKEYQALGLPLPPKEAKLVRYEAGERAESVDGHGL